MGTEKFSCRLVKSFERENVQMEERLKKADKVFYNAFEKGLRTQTNKSQPQVLIEVYEKVRPTKQNCKQDVDDYLKAGKCVLRTEKTHFQRENFIPRKLFRFPENCKSMDRPPPKPARKRKKFVSDNDIIQRLRLLSHNSDKVMNCVKGLECIDRPQQQNSAK